jgi:hypothetical protein
MRKHRIALLTTVVATAVPGAALLAPSAAGAETRCGTITARGSKVAISVTYGSFGCRSARGVYRAYFKQVKPTTNRGRKIRITRGGKTFDCASATTGQFDFLCFPKAGVSSKPIIAADRRGS